MGKRRFKDPVVQKAVLVYLIAALAAYLVFHYGVLGQYREADKVREGNARLSSELQTALADSTRAGELAAEIEANEGRIDDLRRSLPPSLNEAELIRRVTQAAQSAGIDSSFDAFDIKAEPRTENNLTIRTYEVAYITGYHEFGKFVANLSRNLPQVSLSELALVGVASPAEGRTLRGSVVLSVFSSPLAEGAAAPVVTEITSGGVVELIEPHTYDPRGKRDPFLVPGPQPGAQPTAEMANMANLYYRGMMTVDGVPAALVEDAAGFGFSLKVGDAIAGGKVVQITPEELVISSPGYGRRTLKVTQTPIPVY
ncbi:MAG: type 4a pilus biogenesis protein PilO [bacterium]|nr:type 4a pilus biogenesis protein PilO [bacterium]